MEGSAYLSIVGESGLRPVNNKHRCDLYLVSDLNRSQLHFRV